MFDGVPVLLACMVVVVQKLILASFRFRAIFRCKHLLDADISILNSFLYPKVLLTTKREMLRWMDA